LSAVFVHHALRVVRLGSLFGGICSCGWETTNSDHPYGASGWFESLNDVEVAHAWHCRDVGVNPERWQGEKPIGAAIT